MIQNLRIKTRFNVLALIGNSGIGSCQFQVRHALCQSSQRQTKVLVRLHQSRDSKSLRILVSQLHTNILQRLHRHNINGIRNCRADTGISAVAVVVVIISL